MMTLIHKKKKKQPIVLALAVISVIIVIAIIGLVAFGNRDKDESKPVQESQPSFQSLPTEQEEKTTEYISDSKEYYIDYVMVGDEQDIDKFLDIRIRFPNGEDYIVIAEKNITYITDKGFYMYLDEKELHMLSSARTDVEVYEGAFLYLSSYDKKQENGLTEYPINLFVLSAYGQYFDDTEQLYNRRIQLEENLITFMNQTLQK
mgnify:FL=1